MNSLYQKETHFYLNIDSTRHEIAEPVGWDEVDLTIHREDSHGFTITASDGATTLKFMNESLSGFANGYTLISSVLASDGPNGVVVFEFTTVEAGIQDVLFTGLVNLLSYQRTERFIDTSVLQRLDRFKFNNRQKFEVDLEGETDFGGNFILPMPTKTIGLHSKTLKFTATSIYKTTDKTVLNDQYSIPPAGVQATVQEISYLVWSNYNEFDEELLTQTTKEQPVNDPYNIFTAEEDGYFVISVSEHRFEIDSDPNFPALAGTIEARLEYGTPGSLTTVVVGSHNPTSLSQAQIDVNSYSTGIVYLAKGDVIRMWMNVPVFEGNQLYIKVTEGAEVRITSETYELTTQTKAALIYDALRQAVLATSESDALQSDFLQTGAASNMALARGLNIRAFDGRVTLKTGELLDTLRAMFAIGYNWEGGTFRVEEMPHFYQDVEILDVGAVSDVMEEVKEEYFPNQVTIGYKKFLDEELNTLDEFCTYHEYTLSNREEREKKIESPYIASGYAIEYTRRKRFSNKPTTSWKYDDNLFLFEVGKSKYFHDVEFDAAAQTITVRKNKHKGQAGNLSYLQISSDGLNNLTITTGANGGTYAITDIDTNDSRTIFTTSTPLAVSSTYSTYFQWETDFLNAKAAEDFTTVENLIDKHSSYNLNHSPKRMLLRWGPVIRTAVHYDVGTQPEGLIRNTFAKYNGELETQLSTPNAALGDPNARSWREGDSVNSGDLFPDHPFTPIVCSFQVKLNWSQFSLIEQCCRGLHASKSYGYITYSDHEGTKQGYLLDIEYQPGSQRAKLKLIAKA